LGRRRRARGGGASRGHHQPGPIARPAPDATIGTPVRVDPSGASGHSRASRLQHLRQRRTCRSTSSSLDDRAARGRCRPLQPHLPAGRPPPAGGALSTLKRYLLDEGGGAGMSPYALPTSFAGGRYQVKALLGEGSSKRVYLAHDTRLERDVAVAVIRAEALDEESLARVRREAQAMARLGDHAHIVTIHDVGEEGAQTYIVCQYMAGGSLSDLLLRAEKHRLSVADAVRIGGQICAALEHAHALSIIHRDLKPGNVWLAADGTAKLGDFGLAVALDRSRLTVASMIVGTIAYMPPEQAEGRGSDVRSDLYSLGVMLYEMVT